MRQDVQPEENYTFNVDSTMREDVQGTYVFTTEDGHQHLDFEVVTTRIIRGRVSGFVKSPAPAPADCPPTNIDTTVSRRLSRRNSDPALTLTTILPLIRATKSTFAVVSVDPPATSTIPLQRILPWRRRSMITLPTEPDHTLDIIHIGQGLANAAKSDTGVVAAIDKANGSLNSGRWSGNFQVAGLGINVRYNDSDICRYLLTDGNWYVRLYRLIHLAGCCPPLQTKYFGRSGGPLPPRETTTDTDRWHTLLILYAMHSPALNPYTDILFIFPVGMHESLRLFRLWSSVLWTLDFGCTMYVVCLLTQVHFPPTYMLYS